MDTRTERLRAAAIAAVMMALEEESSTEGVATRLPPRHAWKMAGRVERLGVAPGDKPFSQRIRLEVSRHR